MPLNKKLIYEALSKRPLCHGGLILQRGLAIEYCAMGALAADVGATDDYLYGVDGIGSQVWLDFGDKLKAKFGIESYEQFQSFMRVNDAELFATRRNKKVLEHVDALTAEQVNSIIESPVSTEQIVE